MSIETDFAESLEAIYDAIGEDATVWVDDIPIETKLIRMPDYEIDYHRYETYRAIYDVVAGLRVGDEIELTDRTVDIGVRMVSVKNLQRTDDGLEIYIGVG